MSTQLNNKESVFSQDKVFDTMGVKTSFRLLYSNIQSRSA